MAPAGQAGGALCLFGAHHLWGSHELGTAAASMQADGDGVGGPPKYFFSWSISVSIYHYLCIYLSICLIYLSVCLSIYLSVYI